MKQESKKTAHVLQTSPRGPLSEKKDNQNPTPTHPPTHPHTQTGTHIPHTHTLCDIPSGCCFFMGPWTVTRFLLRTLRRVAAFCRPLRPVLLLVSFPRSLCWMWRAVPFAPPPPPQYTRAANGFHELRPRTTTALGRNAIRSFLTKTTAKAVKLNFGDCNCAAAQATCATFVHECNTAPSVTGKTQTENDDGGKTGRR